MMMQEIISPEHRRKVYVVYALVGLIVGSVQVGYAAAQAGQPVWLTVALAVYAFLGTAFGFLAQGNTPTVQNSRSVQTLPEKPEEFRGDGFVG